MALVIISGLPCSGKTTRSTELLEALSQRASAGDVSKKRFRFHHVTNETAHISPACFASQLAEKPARASYLSQVIRCIALDAIVLADGGAGTNIKGFRYQLWCAAREVGVRCASILVVCGRDECARRNAQMGRKYDEETFEEMTMRFEEPNPMTRWDSPLFVVDNSEKSLISTTSLHQLPIDDIWTAITSGRITRAPGVVVPTKSTSTNYLSLLESVTHSVVTSISILSNQSGLPPDGGSVSLPVTLPTLPPENILVQLLLPAGKPTPTNAALQRHKRQFVKMHAAGVSASNELGIAAGKEGQLRDQQIVSQKQSVGVDSADTAMTTREADIARRFAAYLNESL